MKARLTLRLEEPSAEELQAFAGALVAQLPPGRLRDPAVYDALLELVDKLCTRLAPADLAPLVAAAEGLRRRK